MLALSGRFQAVVRPCIADQCKPALPECRRYMTLAGDTPERKEFSGFSGSAGRRRGYQYQRYFCSYSIKVTICVTANLCHFAFGSGKFLLTGLQARWWFSSVPDRRSKHVAETGRPSCKREDHHPRAVAAGGQ